MPFDIPNPFAAAPPPPSPKGLTLADVIGELPDGVTIYQLTTHDSNGKAITDRAPGPATKLQPGDAIEIRGDGKTWLTHVNADISDIDPWTATSAPTKQVPTGNYPDSSAVRGADRTSADAKLMDNSATILNDPDSAQGLKQTALQTYLSAKSKLESEATAASKQPGASNPATIALAATAEEKIRAGRVPTQAESEAYHLVSQGGGAMPKLPGDLAQIITAAAGKYGVPPALLAGVWNKETGGNYPNNFVNSQGYGGLFGTSESDARAKGFSLLDQQSEQAQAEQAAEVLSRGLKASGGNPAGALSFYNTGKVNDPEGLGYAKDVLSFSGGGGAAGYGGLTIPGLAPKQFAPPSPENVALAEKTRQEMLPKTQLALQQHAQTVEYIKQQLASGAFGTGAAAIQLADTYQKANDQYLQAALQGATPFEIEKQRQQFAYEQAQIGKDMINTKLTEGDNLAKSVMSDMMDHSKGYGASTAPASADANPLTYARELNDYNAGGQNMTDLAQALVGTLSPRAAAPGPNNFADVPPPAAEPNPAANMSISDLLDQYSQQNQPQPQGAAA